MQYLNKAIKSIDMKSSKHRRLVNGIGQQKSNAHKYFDQCHWSTILIIGKVLKHF